MTLEPVDDPDEDESEEDDPNVGDVFDSLKGVVTNSWGALAAWVNRRSRLTQIIISVSIAYVAREYLPPVDQMLTTVGNGFPAFSDGQLLIILIGVALGQTMIQTQKLNQLQNEAFSMSSTSPRTDGGRPSGDGERARNRAVGNVVAEAARDPRSGDDGDGTSGGGALGGAIAGAAVGSSFGPGGTVGGLLLGAILGDMFEESANNTQPRDRQGRFKDR